MIGDILSISKNRIDAAQKRVTNFQNGVWCLLHEGEVTAELSFCDLSCLEKQLGSAVPNVFPHGQWFANLHDDLSSKPWTKERSVQGPLGILTDIDSCLATNAIDVNCKDHETSVTPVVKSALFPRSFCSFAWKHLSKITLEHFQGQVIQLMNSRLQVIQVRMIMVYSFYIHVYCIRYNNTDFERHYTSPIFVPKNLSQKKKTTELQRREV